MSITNAYFGSGNIASTQEVSLANTPLTGGTGVGPTVHSNSGVFQCFIDFTNQTGLVEHEFNIYDKVNSQPLRKVYTANIVGPQNPPIFVTPALILGELDITLQRKSGTDTAIAWLIRKIA